MMGRLAILGTVAVLLAGCGQDATAPTDRSAEENEPVTDSTARTDVPLTPSTAEVAPADTAMSVAPLLGEKTARAEWSKAANRATCAPLALRSDKAGGKPRPATFSGGWAVAFDQPDRRSAYGFAGVGALPEDRQDFAVHVDRLAKQWPYVRRWSAGENLPAGSIAGYGLKGAKDYTAGSSGFGQQSVAYLRIPGQKCMYNIWSRLSRDHLELLLDQLELVRP